MLVLPGFIEINAHATTRFRRVCSFFLSFFLSSVFLFRTFSRSLARATAAAAEITFILFYFSFLSPSLPAPGLSLPL